MQQRQSQFRTIPSSPLPSPAFQQETHPLPVPPPDATPLPEPLLEATPPPFLRMRPFSKRRLTRIVAIGLALLLAGAIFVIWFTVPTASPSSPSSNVTQQSFGSSNQNSGAGTPTGGSLHVYIIGSVKHPGVYTLPAGARVYQLLQAAGGALPQADLVSLNLAAPLTDGQEVYVLTVGETPPTYLGGVPGPGTTNGTVTTTTGTQNGQLVNINTATSDEMRTILHVSSTTAQKIIAGRPYTSVAQLLQVVSREIYNKIEASVTV